MELKLGLTKHLLLLIAPLTTVSIATALPGQAASFAFSQGSLEIDNFSHTPQATDTFTDTDTSSVSGPDSENTSNARADATFAVDPPMSFNMSSSISLGEGKRQFGLAQGRSRVIGNFFIETGQSFSFDFTSSLELETSIDHPEFEDAIATGEVFFLGIDNARESTYDYFRVLGSLSKGDNDYLKQLTSKDIALTSSARDTHFGGMQELAEASVSGSLQQSFSHPTSLTLVAVTRNQAVTQVPEPSSSLAVLGLILVGIGSRIGGLKSAMSNSKSITKHLPLLHLRSRATRC